MNRLILGVNSLALDASRCDIKDDTAEGGVLYSAGRDGVVASWDLNIRFKRQLNTEEAWLVDKQLQSAGKSTCKAFSQIHTDWVNDIVLCQEGTCVVSASSDRTIKAWRPYSENSKTVHTIGTHTDYAKCLTYASQPGWVASGGLDKKINIWDISQSKAVVSIDAGPSNHYADGTNESSTLHNSASKCSIYALAANAPGTIIASGSPEKVIRLWDPRSGKRIGKLTGHTDNIRALLVSQDGNYVLSGSSDATIKLWSVHARRCLATYETHPDSVWSLFSDHPDLRTFYSGSRDGLVTRTEISGRALSESENECIGLFKENSGVVKIAALQDTYVWTATSSSSINRWLSVPSSKKRQILPRSNFNPEVPAKAMIKLPPAKDTFSASIRDSYIASDQLTMYAGSVLSIPISYHEDEDNQDTLVPLRSEPDSVIRGGSGIVSHLMLQNRIHVLTKDTNGEVTMWDLIRCIQLKNFGKRDLQEVAQEVNSLESSPAWCTIDTKIGAITVQLHETNCFDCELYADEIELPKDYEVREDQRLNLGKWILANLFAKYVEKEVEYQQNGDTRFIDEQTEKPESVKSKTQQPLSEQSLAQQRPGPLEQAPSAPSMTIPPVETEEPKPPLAAMTTHAEQSPYVPTSPQAAQFAGPFTAPVTSSPQPDYFSGNHHTHLRRESAVQLPPPAALPSSPTSPTASTFMNRLKNLSVKAKLSRIPTNEERPLFDTPQPNNTISSNSPSVVPSATTTTTTTVAPGTPTTTAEEDSSSKPNEEVNTPKLKEIEESRSETYNPVSLDDFPPLDIPESTTIIIAEESAEASTGMDLYRGTVGSTGEDADIIIDAAPSWLLSYLLYNKIPTKETIKLTFVLRPANGTKLEELPGGSNNRLLANRMLRVRKLIQYVAEKLHIEDESSLELLCGDTPLTFNMTLAAIRQHILKTGGDIPISYRLKGEVNA
ncbi:unnamed protein product [Rhizopus microsporus]